MPWISEHQIKEVDYNTFINMVDNGEVSTVEIQQQNNRILFQGNDNRKIYKTAMLPDNDLVSHLLDANVSTTGEEIEQTSALEHPCVGAADHTVCRSRAVYVTQDDGKDGRWELHDVQHGKVQRQGLCKICGKALNLLMSQVKTRQRKTSPR